MSSLIRYCDLQASERDGFFGGTIKIHMRVYRAPVTAARLLDGARSLLGYQTRYAAVGCHHGLQVLQPTR
jgi:hypothetical protein